MLRKYRLSARVKSAFLRLASGLSARSPTRVSRRVCRCRVLDCCPQMLVLSTLSGHLLLLPAEPSFLTSAHPIVSSISGSDVTSREAAHSPRTQKGSCPLGLAAPHLGAPALTPSPRLVRLLLPNFLRWASRGQRCSHSLCVPVAWTRGEQPVGIC